MKTYFWFEVSSNFLIVTVGDYNRNTQKKYKFYFVLKRLYNVDKEQSLLIGEIRQEKDSEKQAKLMSAPCTELQERDERKRALTSKYFFTFFFFFLFTYTTDFTEKRGPLVSHLQCYPHFIPFLNAGRNNCFKNTLKNLFRFKISSNNFPFLSPLCNLLAFTRSVCDFANKPITSKNSDLDKGKLTWTFFAYI